MENNLEQEILYGFEKLFSVNRLLLWDISKKFKISPLQLQILYYIEYNNVKLLSELADELEISKATISESITNMVKKELIYKKKDNKDKRKYQIFLTKKGHQLLKQLVIRDNILLQTLKDANQNEKISMYNILKIIIKSLLDNEIISRAKICYKCQNFQQIEDKFYCKFLGQFISYEEIRLNCPEFLFKKN